MGEMNYINKMFYSLRDMSPILNPWGTALGYEFENEEIENEKIMINAVTVLGYVPVLGRIIGIIRMIASVSFYSDARKSGNLAIVTAHFTRGVIEACGVFLLARIIADIAATIFQQYLALRYKQNRELGKKVMNDLRNLLAL